MTASIIRRKSRSRVELGTNLIPVTLRMTAQDRAHLERTARLRRSSLSEWLRDVIEDHKSNASLYQRLDQIEKHLCDLGSQISSDWLEIEDSARNMDQKIVYLTDNMAATTGSVEHLTTLIQGSFEQLFQAFFQLQTYIEHVLKAPGIRK